MGRKASGEIGDVCGTYIDLAGGFDF